MKTFRVVQFEPQMLNDLGAILLTASEMRGFYKKVAKEFGISESRFGEIAEKIRREMDKPRAEPRAEK